MRQPVPAAITRVSSTSNGTPGVSLATRITREVLTLPTFSAVVSFFRQKTLETAEVRGNAFQHEIDFTVQHVAFANQWPVATKGLKRAEVRFGLTLQSNHGEDLNLEAQKARVDICVITVNEPGFLKCANAAQAGRGGNANPACQFYIRHPSISLQLGQNLTVDLIKFMSGHRAPCYCEP